MARFNLDDYETVESRIKRFYEAHEDGRIVTEWVNEFNETTGPRLWVMKASIYLSAGDQANNLPKATGYATETDGSGGANNVDACANGETSCIGRALANMSMSGNKRASRTEMEKVQRAETAKPVRNFLTEADKLSDVTQLRLLWAEAKASGAPEATLTKIKDRADAVSSTSSVSTGTQGSVPKLFGEDAPSSKAGVTPNGAKGEGRK